MPSLNGRIPSTTPTGTTRDDGTGARLAALVRSSADAIVGETLDGIVTDWNPAAERLYGFRAEEVIGRPLTMLISSDRMAEAEDILARAHRGEHVADVETERWTKDGRRIVVSLSVSPVWNDAGEITATSAIVRDITAQKAMASALADSEALFRAAFENAPIGLFLTSPDGTTLRVNRALCAMLGYAVDELLATNAWALTHPEDIEPNRTFMRRALAGEIDTYELEKRYLHNDGHIVWGHLSGSLVRDDTGIPRYFISQIQDITERKRAETELRAALEAAEAANQAKSHFLAMTSHELRTPLQAVLGYAEFLLADPQASLTVEQRDDLGYIQQGGRRMLTLINQMLDLSRIEAGRLDLVAQPVDLARILEQVRQDVAPQVSQKGLELHIQAPETMPPVLGDAERLRQILLNLVGNAVKFTDYGSVAITTEMAKEMVAITVRDTGNGIAPEALPHIFEAFRQGDSRLARRHGGAGLGLAIAQKLAELMGGRISVESALGIGSTFTLQVVAVPSVRRTAPA